MIRLSVDVTCPHNTQLVLAEVDTSGPLTAASVRARTAGAYRIAAALETLFADGSGPDGSGPDFEVLVRTATLDRVAWVRLTVPAGIDLADAEDMMIEACVACGIEPEHAGSGPVQSCFRPKLESMTDEALLQYLNEQDPNCEHDDLHEPDGELAEYWRAAGNRGLLNH